MPTHVETNPRLFLAIFVAAAVIFALTPLMIAQVWAKFFSPKKPGPLKNATYECGLAKQPIGWVQFKAEYYLYAIVFLVFDVEILFLLPFAAVFKQLSIGTVIAMLVFVLLLVEGLAWACVKGVLSWRTQ
ncbi:MAG: NADH-quinone oxidoreductase subunit A [Limisphaerales bacterium]